MNVLSVAPLTVIPAPSAVVSVGLSILANSIFLSSTVNVVELIVVVVPFTVKLPAIVVPVLVTVTAVDPAAVIVTLPLAATDTLLVPLLIALINV